MLVTLDFGSCRLEFWKFPGDGGVLDDSVGTVGCNFEDGVEKGGCNFSSLASAASQGGELF